MPVENIVKHPIVKIAGFVLVAAAGILFLFSPTFAYDTDITVNVGESFNVPPYSNDEDCGFEWGSGSNYGECYCGDTCIVDVVGDYNIPHWDSSSGKFLTIAVIHVISPTPTPTPDPSHCMGSDVCGSPGIVVLDPNGVMQWNPSLKSTNSWCYRLTSVGTWTVGGSAYSVSDCGAVSPTPTMTLYPTPSNFPTASPTGIPGPHITSVPIGTIGTLPATWAPVVKTDDYKKLLRNSTVGNITAPFLDFSDSVGIAIQNFGTSVLSFLLIPFSWLTSYGGTVIVMMHDSAVALASIAKYVLLMVASVVNILPASIQMLITFALCCDAGYIVLKGRAGNG